MSKLVATEKLKVAPSGLYASLPPVVGDRLEFVARMLRLKCLDYGASLIYTSDSFTGVSKSVNSSLLQDYLKHRMFPDLYTSPEPKFFIVGNSSDLIANDDLFIPAGSDSLSLIESTLSYVSVEGSKSVDSGGRVCLHNEASFSDIFPLLKSNVFSRVYILLFI